MSDSESSSDNDSVVKKLTTSQKKKRREKAKNAIKKQAKAEEEKQFNLVQQKIKEEQQKLKEQQDEKENTRDLFNYSVIGQPCTNGPIEDTKYVECNIYILKTNKHSYLVAFGVNNFNPLKLPKSEINVGGSKPNSVVPRKIKPRITASGLDPITATMTVFDKLKYDHDGGSGNYLPECDYKHSYTFTLSFLRRVHLADFDGYRFIQYTDENIIDNAPSPYFIRSDYRTFYKFAECFKI